MNTHTMNSKKKYLQKILTRLKIQKLNWFNQYQIPKNLHPTASFTTLRNVYAFENGELCLDKTYYKNHTDYEIEYEYTSDHDGIHFFNSILEKYGLKWVKNCPSKIARALND